MTFVLFVLCVCVLLLLLFFGEGILHKIGWSARMSLLFSASFRMFLSLSYISYTVDTYPGCVTPLGMENKKIPDSALKATTAVSMSFSLIS